MDTLGMLLKAQSPTRKLWVASPRQWIHPNQPGINREIYKNMLYIPSLKIKYLHGTHDCNYDHIITKCSEQTFTERQCEFGQRTGSKSLMPVIVPMYLKSTMLVPVESIYQYILK